MNAKINTDLHHLLRPIEMLTPDPKNARRHGARDLRVLSDSLEMHGQQKPIVALRSGTVIAGNGTLEAAKSLGWKELAVVTYDDADEAKARAFALVDNRSAELSEWNPAMLSDVLADLQVSQVATLAQIGFSATELEALLEPLAEKPEQYTLTINVPIYEPKNAKPTVLEMYDETKTKEMEEEILATDGLPSEVRAFLLAAAQRHTVFNFAKIADFYAHAPAEVQRLFEKSALVIIDFNRAIELGFVKLTKDLAALYGRDVGGEDA